MSEIEKMYENAGVLKECLSPCYINKTWRKTHDCPNCDNRENYPPFTAEKQIELIKFLMGDYSSYLNIIDTNNFENSLASYINYLWLGLSEEEKQQIKEILENE